MIFSFLKKNDRIGIAAPSSAFSEHDFRQGVAVLESLGYRVHYRPDIFFRHHGFAGDEARRIDELHEHFSTADIKAILFARGGWGIQRIISRVDIARIRPYPKLILGYSDLTTLHLYLYHALKWPFFYGPVVAKDISHMSPSALGSLSACLDGTIFKEAVSLRDAEVLAPGTAYGPVIGGCLTLLMTASGTAYGIPFRDHMLFIEDVNEKPYAIDRMLTHLRETGRLQGVKGLICGRFKDCGEMKDIKAIVREHFGDSGVPILWNTPYGHGPDMHTLPLGIDCTLTTSPTPQLRFRLS